MRNIQQLFVAIIITMLAACGGGGSLGTGNTGGGNTDVVYSLDLTLAKSNGLASSELSQATPLTVKATLSATNDGVIANKVISFTLSDPALASFSNQSGTALTDANGVATIVLLVGTKSGAGQVEASFNDAITNVGFNSAGDGGGTVDVSIGSLTLLANKLQLGSGGSDKVELYALVKDSRNVLMADVPVVFSTSPTGALGGELEIVKDVTGNDGIAIAVLKSQIDPSLRTIDVTAKVADKSQTITVNVVGTSIDVSAPEAMVVGDNRTISMLVRDFTGNALANQTLLVSSALGNTLSMTEMQTNNVGQAEVIYTAINSGRDTVSVSGLGLTQVLDINVSPDEFVFSEYPEEDIFLGSPSSSEDTPFVTLTWLKNGTPWVGEVSFVITRGIIFADANNPVADQTGVKVTTNAQGNAKVYLKSDSAGFTTISASAGEGDDLVTAQLSLEFVANTVDSVEVQASPSQLGVNEQSSVRAIIRDSKNNPVKGKTVNFVLTGDAGGLLNPASGITNSQGIASTIYTATAATGANSVHVTAKVEGKSGSTSLSVGQRTLFFRFGTGNTVEVVSPTLFRKEFSVVVTDASGNPVANQALNIAVTPVNPIDVASPNSDEWAYAKGRWVMLPNEKEFEYWAPQFSSVIKDATGTPPDHDFQINEVDPNDPSKTITKYGYYTRCQNEDSNLNGVLDDGEDANNDGFLTPGNVVTVQQSETSDENGIAVFSLTYPADYAGWTHVNITVSALASGTENRNSRKYILSYPSSYVVNKAAAPAKNPFGSSNSCGDTF
ncbi:hypothetical protein E0Z06_04910 [Rheinheimera sp. D18]|uniref:Ig-like domain-containing protein n=1 Tax=Rheinheimera sp. D18 TaxID=2545632 RepID=UPI00104586E7|nr:Ig-like domain-containing protein [Rheinheimera sp. D18]QBL08898.1 hypothetical protein E0Z06_04910 [Rheinheimera sp. D18]